jgi:hypothetical protein
MVMDFPPRRAYFVMAGGERSPDELTDILGVMPDDVTYKGQARSDAKRSRPALENSWKIIERGGAGADVSVLLEDLYVRLHPIADKIRVFRDAGWTTVVRVVLYASELDETNPSFLLDGKMIALLNDIGAFFEVDMYVENLSI